MDGEGAEGLRRSESCHQRNSPPDQEPAAAVTRVCPRAPAETDVESGGLEWCGRCGSPLYRSIGCVWGDQGLTLGRRESAWYFRARLLCASCGCSRVSEEDKLVQGPEHRRALNVCHIRRVSRPAP